MTIKASNFTCVNLRAVIERANEILEGLKLIGSHDAQRLVASQLSNWLSRENLDEWESAAWMLVKLELFERQVRIEDRSMPRPNPGYNGGMNDLSK
jgi:hypothetical protein